MFEVTFFLKSGQTVFVEYEDRKAVDDIVDLIVDPGVRVFVLHSDDDQVFLPAANIDYVGVKNVQ